MKKYKGVLWFLVYCIMVFAIFACVMEDGTFKAVEYTVQPGDTYDVLASKFGVTEDLCVWRERVKMYNGKSGSCLYVGETIFVLIEGGHKVSAWGRAAGEGGKP